MGCGGSMKVRKGDGEGTADGTGLTEMRSGLYSVHDGGRERDAERERDPGLQVRGQGRAAGYVRGPL